MADHLDRIAAIALRFPEATRVDVEAWDGHPTFRVRDKTFVFAANDGSSLTVKLDKEEAAAVVATEPGAEPAGYGLGRAGWVSIKLTADAPPVEVLEDWVEESYRQVALKRLIKELDARSE